MKNDELLKPHNSAALLEQSDNTVSSGLAEETLPLDSSLEDLDEEQETKSSLPLETLPLPAFQLRYITLQDIGKNFRREAKTNGTLNGNAAKVPAGRPQSLWQRIRTTDGWLLATFLVACVASSLSLWYFFEMHQTLLYGDANAHLLIARRVFDNLTPGLAQLGAIWLPLPHLLMVPLVWNDYLWRTGLAGSIVSMLSYLTAAIYIFLSARRLTNNSVASFIGTLVFILNPNILYLQSTPLSELVLMGTLAATCYYFLVWAQTDSTKYLILTAGAMFLTTLSRYDGWFVFAVVLVLIVLVGLVRRHPRTHIEGNLFLFGSMGSLGIILWFIWNFLIFGDPLYFQRSPFSSQAQQRSLINSHILYTYHNVFQAIRFYLIDCIDTVGPVLFGVGVLAFLLFLVQRRIRPETLASLIFVCPIAFYMISLYTGQAALYLPTAVPGYAPYTIYNVRYGEVVVMPVAIFLASLIAFFSDSQRRPVLPRFSGQRLGQIVGRYVLPLLCLGMVVGQSVWIVSTGIITLQDGQYGLACTPTYRIVIYLAQHYNGGRILQDLYTSKVDTLEPTAGIYFKNMIYEGSGQLWKQALSHPEAVVDWIIVNRTETNDAIAKKIDLTSPAFTSHFSFVVQEESGLALYHRNGLPPLPTYNVPRSVFTEHQFCGQYKPGQFASLPRSQDLEGIAEVDRRSTSAII
jgi:hypothetical protein